MATNLQTGIILRRGGLIGLKKIRSQYRSWHRRQYFLTSAHRDIRTAARQNEDIFLGTVLAAGILIYGYSAIMATLLIDVLETVYALTEFSSASFTVIMAIAVAVLTVTTAWVAALIGNALSIAIMHGINRKQNRSLRQTFRLALSKATTTVTAWALIIKQIALPLIIAIIITGIFIKAVPFKDNYWLLGIPVAATLIAVAMSLRQLIHTSLVPYIMLFEGKTTYTDAFIRSRELLATKGRLFLIAGYISSVAAVSASYGIATLINDLLGLPTGLTFFCSMMVALLYSNILLTAFYSKRRRARSSK